MSEPLKRNEKIVDEDLFDIYIDIDWVRLGGLLGLYVDLSV